MSILAQRKERAWLEYFGLAYKEDDEMDHPLAKPWSCDGWSWATDRAALVASSVICAYVANDKQRKASSKMPTEAPKGTIRIMVSQLKEWAGNPDWPKRECYRCNPSIEKSVETCICTRCDNEHTLTVDEPECEWCDQDPVGDNNSEVGEVFGDHRSLFGAQAVAP